MKRDERLIIYQLFPRILTNDTPDCVAWGSIEKNGCGKFNQITPEVIKSIGELGVNCLWLTGVIEMATKTDFSDYGIPADNPNVVKGEAGSPYAIKDYYDVSPSLAENVAERMSEFENCVDRIHAGGMKVIIDFVPNHTARRYHSDVAPKGIKDFGADDDIRMFFTPSNNYYYIPNQRFSPYFSLDREGNEPYVEFPAKATGNDCFTAFCHETDWYETVKLNYGVDYFDHSEHFDPIPDTWMKMLHILRFWASKGIDGFRCDMVFMVPLAFWHWAIPQVKKDYPGIIFIGEIYDVGLYRPFLDYGCFDYLYDKVNLYDTLVGIETRHVSAACLTGCWQTVDGIGERMLNFLENHDEVRFASKAYAGDPMRVVPSLVTGAMMTKGPYMIYYGQELGEPAADNEGFAGDNDRTTIFYYWSLATLRRWYAGGKCDGSMLTPQEKWLRGFYAKVLRLCNENAALREGGFFDLMYVNLQNPGFDPHGQFAFFRYHEDEVLLIVANFEHKDVIVDINVPELAFDMMHLEKGLRQTKDLLTGKPVHLSLDTQQPVRVSVSGSGALVIPVGRSTVTTRRQGQNRRSIVKIEQ